MSFQTDLERGKLGENLVLAAMVQRGHDITDVSDNEEYWSKDIDFLIDGRTCELKTDFRIGQTGNLFLEFWVTYYNENSQDGKGWFRTSEAEYLLYLDWLTKELHIYRMDELRWYVDDAAVQTKTCRDSNKEVYGYCLSKDAVPHQTIVLNKEEPVW